MSSPCPACGGREFHVKYANLVGVDGAHYDVMVCAACSFGTISPMPSQAQLEKFYSSRYESRTKANIYAHTSTDDFLKTNQSDIEDNHTLLSYLAPYAPGRRLLDVGCGHGLMCYAAGREGYDALGVDYDADAKRLGERHLGVRLMRGSVTDVGERDFDVVTEIMSLEHVREPLYHISLIKERLRDCGLYAGSVPNFGGIYARLRGRNWYHLIPPEHINYFSERTLRIFLKRAGFEPLFVGTIPLYAAPTFSFGIRGRLNAVINKQQHPWAKKALLALYGALTLLKRYALYKPLNFIIMRFKLPGNGIFWVARKTSAPGAVSTTSQ